MTIKNRNNYLEALGIPDFFYSQSDSEKKVIPEVKCLIIETTSQDSFCEPGESQDLLIKILTSIDLTLSNVCLSQLKKIILMSALGLILQRLYWLWVQRLIRIYLFYFPPITQEIF